MITLHLTLLAVGQSSLSGNNASWQAERSYLNKETQVITLEGNAKITLDMEDGRQATMKCDRSITYDRKSGQATGNGICEFSHMDLRGSSAPKPSTKR